MRLLHNHIYEFRKGVRSLFMLTLRGGEIEPACARLRREGIDHFVQWVGSDKGNIFFGRTAWVETARRIITHPLNRMTPEQDFILGTLLGYDGEGQCRRYLDRRDRRERPGDAAPLPARAHDWQGAAATV